MLIVGARRAVPLAGHGSPCPYKTKLLLASLLSLSFKVDSVRLKEGNEVKKIVILIAALALFPAVLAGCGNSPASPQEVEKAFAAMKQHDTRVVVVCRGSQGQYYKKSLHKSESVTCGDATFRLEDFAKIRETDRYVAFPGYEKELEEYLKTVKEENR